MSSFLSWIPPVQELFPPTPKAYSFFYNVFKYFGLAGFITTAVPQVQAMGRMSTKSRLNLPGRYTWSLMESIGPVYLTYIIFTLPSRLHPRPASPSSFLFTGLPAWNEILYLLYIVHYINRAIITPLFAAPSMSPIHLIIALAMSIFQFFNAGSIGSWLVYSSITTTGPSSKSHQSTSSSLLTSSLPFQILGLALFTTGLYVNIRSEHHLFSLRRAAAKRKARSEGKPFVTYEKVYVIPPAATKTKDDSSKSSSGKEDPPWFHHVLFPHYLAEWIEWLGYYGIALASGLTATLHPTTAAVSSSPLSFFRAGKAGGVVGGWWWLTPPLWFVINEVMIMFPRAREGRKWYEQKFGKRAVAGRGAVAPVGWL